MGKMTIKEAIEYLQPIADSAQLAGYSAALAMALEAMREVDSLREKLKKYEDKSNEHD